jgi:uncharacterized membrane protein YoaK (UPF0700 family)
MALAVASGATDAIGFLALGHVFTSAMTGNLVLLAISLGQRDGGHAGTVVVSVLCFITGAALGARIAGKPRPGDAIWPQAATLALVAEVPLFSAYGAAWWLTGGRPDGSIQLVMLGVGAVALGLQSSAMQRVNAGLNTTFLSGSLTVLVGRLTVDRQIHDVRHHLLVLLGLVIGGAGAATMMWHAPMWAPATPLGAIVAAVLLATWSATRCRHQSQPTTR